MKSKFYNNDNKDIIIAPEVKKVKTKEEKEFEESLKTAGLNIIPYPTNKSSIHKTENMKNGVIGSIGNSIFCGQSSSGKTTLLLNLAQREEFYKDYYQIIYLFSPTANFDDLSKWFKVPKSRCFKKPDAKFLNNVVDTQKDLIENKYDGDISKAPRICLIFEDIIPYRRFMNSDIFIELYCTARHYAISTFLCTQSWTKVPRVCRLQCHNAYIFPCSNSEQKCLADEYCPPNYSKREFKELCGYCWSDKHSFLHINFKEPFKTRFRKNLNEVLELSK